MAEQPAVEGAQPEPLDPNRHFCPYCGTDRPPIGFVNQVAGLGSPHYPIGKVEYFIMFCGVESCRRILQVQVMKFTPGPALIEQAGILPGGAVPFGSRHN